MTFAVLDLGSTRISGMLARKDETGAVIPIAYAEAQSHSAITRGEIANTVEAASCIASVIEELNRHTEENYCIKSVYVGINCRGMQTHHEEFVQDLPERTSIKQEMLDELDEKIGQISYPGREIIYINRPIFHTPNRVTNPLGVICNKGFKASYTLVSVRQSVTRNIREVIETQLNLKLLGFLVTPMCECKVVVSKAYRDLGCAFVNIGGGCTTISIYKEDDLEHLYVYPFGGINITRDITTMKLSFEEAEQIKRDFASAQKQFDDRKQPISFQREDVGLVQINRMDLNNITSLRVQEIISNVKSIIKELGYKLENIKGNITFSGGTTLLQDINVLISALFPGTTSIKKGIISTAVATGTQHATRWFNDYRYISVIGLVQAATEDCLGVIYQDISKLVELNDQTNRAQMSPHTPQEEELTEDKEEEYEEEETEEEIEYEEQNDEEEEEDNTAPKKEQKKSNSETGILSRIKNFVQNKTEDLTRSDAHDDYRNGTIDED